MVTKTIRTGAAAALVAVLSLAPAAPADAQRRWEDGKKKEADLGKKTEAGIDESLKEDLTRPKTEVREARPALQFEQFRRTVELQVAEKRREQIETLSRIVDLGETQGDQADLLFRLAELYWEEAKYYFFLANQKDDDVIAAKGDQRKVQSLKSEQKRLLSESENFRVQAIQQYRRIVRGHPDYERLDEVLYSLGSNLWEQRKQAEALKVYKVLIRKFPKSEYVPDAFLSFGEYFFAEGDIRKALRAYEKASTFTESKVYGFAMYKQGWCHYNLGAFEKSLDLFKAVIFYGDIASGVSGDNKIALVREARRDYVLAYSHVGSPKAAKEDFAAIGGDEAGRMLKNLANIYYDSGKDREAIIVYRTLIKEKPLAPEAPGYQARIVDAAQRIGNKRYTVKQARLLTRLFNEVEGAGVIKTDKEKAGLAEAKEFSERTIRTLAVTWHAEAKKTRDDETFFLAHELYGDYVTLFPQTKHEYSMRFYFAELLYHLEKFPEAAEQYTKALLIDIERLEGKRTDDDGKPEKVGKFLTEAAFNAILSYEEVARKFEETEERPSVPATQTIEIPPAKRALLDACERYLKYIPKGDKTVEINYKVANIYYRYNEFDKAVERFAVIALEHPNHDLAEYSANLVLDSYNLLDRPEKVNEWARRFYANEQLAKDDYRVELRRFIEESALTMVERATKEGKHEDAALAYESFVKEFPRSKKADKALYNASVSWANAKKLDRALQLRARIIQDYPKSDLVPEAIFTTAKGYESVADFAQAAGYYETYAERFAAQNGASTPARGKRTRRPPPKDGPKFEEAKAQEALFNAAVLREGLGQTTKARINRVKYVELWPNAKDAKDLHLSIVDLYEREGNAPKAVKQLEEYLGTYAKNDVDKNLLFRLRMAEIYEKSGNRKVRALANKKYDEIRGYYAKLGKRKSKVTTGLLAVATVELKDLEPMRREYNKLRLEYPWEEGVPPKKLFAFLETIDARAQNIKTQAQLNRLKRDIKQTTDRLKRGVAVSDKKFKASLAKKTDELKKVVAEYTKIVKYKQGEPALCALEKIGGMYLNYIETLRKAPPPPYLQNEEQELVYRDNLNQEALPVEDKAVEAFSTAVAKSRELKLYNECAVRSLKNLKEMRPTAWPEVVELRPDLQALAAQRLGGDFLTAIQEVPEGFGEKGELPADVAGAPPPSGRSQDTARRGSEPDDALPPPDDSDLEGAPRSARRGPSGKKSLDEIYAEPEDEDLLP